MKRWLSLLLTLILLLSLAACARPDAGLETDRLDAPPMDTDMPPESETPFGDETPTAEPGAFHFTRENFPRLDGSTSTAPLAEAVCMALLGEKREEIADLVSFSKTTNAYMNLLSGGADLLIVGEANDEVFAKKDALGFEWLQTPFATDAFVFVVNEANPVDSITVDEARRIYTGEITNWSELGGEDRPITAFQRNQGAGSQTLMEKLVMNGEPMMEAPTDYIVATMGDLIEAVRAYDNSPSAIGYTVYYYAEEMRMAQGLKILKLEGVEPNPDTIRDEVYPLVNPKYVVIPADAAEGAPNRALYDWLLSEAGQRLIAAEGYVSVMAFDPAPKAAVSVGSRWYEDYTGALIPRDDYGLLIPYAGLRLMDDWPSVSGCLFGLMTRDGKVVVDPVYVQVEYAGFGNGAFPLLILRQGGEGNGLYAVAAGDGSWCTEFQYQAVRSGQEGLILHSGGAVTLMGPDGSVLTELTAQSSELTEALLRSLLSSMTQYENGGEWYGDYISLSYENYPELLCCQVSTGKLVTMSEKEFLALCRSGNTETADDTVPGARRVYDEAIGPDAPYLLEREIFTGDGNDRREYYRADGTPLPKLTTSIWTWSEQVSLRGGLIERLDLNTASYYDLTTMECVFRTYLNYETDE